MGQNTSLKYRTFNQLLSEVEVDFQNYSLEAFIEPQQLIKIAKKVNYELGLRIMMNKEAVLEVEKGRVKLPDDFYVLNFGLLCDEQTLETFYPQGTNIQEIPVTPYKETTGTIDVCAPIKVNCNVHNTTTCDCSQPVPAYNPVEPYGDYCVKPRVFMNCKNEAYELVQIVNTATYTYKRFLPLRILQNSKSIICDCPNLNVRSTNEAWIKDNFLWTNFDCGKVYINYQGTLEDSDGNLLVPDHDMLNEYYEYALKKRILENLIMNDENVSQAKIQLIQDGYRTSRIAANTIVNTPNFSELKDIWVKNRKAQYGKYYKMFMSYPWYQWDRNPNNFMGEKIV